MAVYICHISTNPRPSDTATAPTSSLTRNTFCRRINNYKKAWLVSADKKFMVNLQT